MKWQQFLALLMAAGPMLVLVWRSSGMKTGWAGGPDGEARQADAVR